MGSSDNASGDPRAVIWANDAITDLGTLGGPASIGYPINDLGQVTGTSETASGAIGVFLDSGGTMTGVGTFGNSTIPEAINNHFVVYATIAVEGNGFGLSKPSPRPESLRIGAAVCARSAP